VTRPTQPEAIAGTARAYDPCPVCGDVRIRHLAPPASGCTAVRKPKIAVDPAYAGEVGGLCDCPLDRDWQDGVI
jgi:hypothetical protein